MLFSEAMGMLERERNGLAARIEALKENTGSFQPELDRLLATWKDKEEPVTGTAWIAEEEMPDQEWGKRLRLFNGHFIDFVITRDPVLVVRDSSGWPEAFDVGFKPRGKAENFALHRTAGSGVQPKRDLVDILGERVIELGRREELRASVEDRPTIRTFLLQLKRLVDGALTNGAAS
jgi:hypothetical protein